jgi:hypothetical protein
MFELEINDKEISTSYKPDKPRISEKAKMRSKNRAFLRKENAENIINEIGQIKEDESYELITNGQSNAGGFYEVIRDKWESVDELLLATWIINRQYVEMIKADLDSGKLKKVIFIISNRMAQLGHHKGNFNLLKSYSNNTNFILRVVNSHSKTFSMTNGKDYIVVEGSGNWSENPRIENYRISNSKSGHEFRKEWMTELIKAD